ncbi:B-cell differentiation antigen CD72 isoform X3 [Rousettus aegyptiacus]|uniref:B-cell differentiation antigen CD72 isoform X3 n=1 Tax=Rousettus aegyptiacus TaxID=9407 RepID=UPI00168D2EEF|nr:B-cell differentiation antigen CD72 isoform X3 [Rousettus aegyptiacus]XP_015985979.2 B-cell differentiation antigen CD72 isoform X3 [Rousettus aegyptiacus]
MAEAVTYADLRFVKAPLKKNISSQLGKDPEADEDGELTYENVQVPPSSGGALSLTASGLGDKTSRRAQGVHLEPPTACWSSVTSPAAGQPLGCCAVWFKYLLLGLLLTCLLLGMAAISLGVRYLQVSQQLQHTKRVLEATNSSLRQQLRLSINQLGQREQDLQGSRRELAQSQEALQVEQRDCQAVKEQLQACQSDREKTKETLRSEEEQRRNLEERLNRMRDTLKPLFICPSPDTCCPVGWILNERNCFHISLTKRSWEESQNYCKSLSSNLATVNGYSDYYYYSSLGKVLPSGDSYWITLSNSNKDQHRINGVKVSGSYAQNPKCIKVQDWWPKTQSEKCITRLPCICEMAAFRYPDGDHSLH